MTVQSHQVIVVGGGISGVACARQVADAGLPVRLVDRGRRLGGRMAVRTVSGHAIDLGASYFTVSDPAFASVVDGWRERGLARVWTDRFHTGDGTGLTGVKAGPERWAATGGLRSLVEELATGLEIEQGAVESVGPGPRVGGESAACVVLAMPDPQASRLLAADDEALGVATHQWQPSLALAARWPTRVWPSFDGAFVSDLPCVSWLADDGRRRGDDAPVLVAHAPPEYARQQLSDPDAAEAGMLADVARVLGVTTEPEWTTVQRWTFAQPSTKRGEPFYLSSSGIGLCGDGWSERPSVQAAYLSGRALGDAVVSRLS